MGAEQIQAVSGHKYAPDERIAGTPYRVVRLIGVGGMGSVYEVEHEVLGRRFVFKLLHDRLAARSDLVARMQNEWRALAGLKHPNIVQVTDAGFTRESLPFYVMEKLEGQTVAALIRAQKRVDLRTAGRILLDVLAGLDAAHRVYVVHRDIKPQNLFRTTDGTTKLLDFGIAKLQEKSKRVVTQAGVALGTPRYMAPEQAEGKSVDGRADIYACGLVLYELLSGVNPFHHWKEPTEIVLAQIHEEPLRLDAIRPDISPVVSDLVQRWLSKSPDSRPLSAELARRELAAVVGLAKDEASSTLSDVTSVGAYDADTLGPVAAPSPPGPRRESTRPPESNVRPSRQTQPASESTETFVDLAPPERELTTTGEPYPDEPTRPLFAPPGVEVAYGAPAEDAEERADVWSGSRAPVAYLLRDRAAVPTLGREGSWWSREWRPLALAFVGAFAVAAAGALLVGPGAQGAAEEVPREGVDSSSGIPPTPETPGAGALGPPASPVLPGASPVLPGASPGREAPAPSDPPETSSGSPANDPDPTLPPGSVGETSAALSDPPIGKPVAANAPRTAGPSGTRGVPRSAGVSGTAAPTRAAGSSAAATPPSSRAKTPIVDSGL